MPACGSLMGEFMIYMHNIFITKFPICQIRLSRLYPHTAISQTSVDTSTIVLTVEDCQHGLLVADRLSKPNGRLKALISTITGTPNNWIIKSAPNDVPPLIFMNSSSV